MMIHQITSYVTGDRKMDNRSFFLLSLWSDVFFSCGDEDDEDVTSHTQWRQMDRQTL